MLRIDGLSAWYGEAQVLRDVHLDVDEGSIVTLIGRNGAGKTTLLRCVMGLHRQQRGAITHAGNDITRLAPHKRARAGIGWVPDDRGIYAGLTVEENLTLPRTTGDNGWPGPRSTTRSPFGGNAAATREPGCPAASSRCSPWPGCCA